MPDYTHFRQMKDEFFEQDSQSPLTHEQQHDFDGLKYFEPNDDLRLELPVDEFADKEPVQMQTSTGDVQTYERWGRISFEVDGEQGELTIYSNEHGLFMPFTDATSGKETYGAGRYLEPEQIGADKVFVDFNVAYSPYCAYNEMYSCPIPPIENRLKVSIRAGEKNFK